MKVRRWVASSNYTASDGSSTSTAQVTVSQDTGTINGGSADEILISNSSSTAMNGHEGNDILIGNNGNDRLNGGDGNDILEGGAIRRQLRVR